MKAFNLSEKYRLPVLLMSEEAIGHMYEKVTILPQASLKLTPRRRPNVPPQEYLPYVPDDDLVPPMAIAGEGYQFPHHGPDAR